MTRMPVSARDALGALALLGGGAAFAAAERRQKLDAFDGLWWAFATVTTVGYGDITPKTRRGRMIAAGLMLQRLLITRQAAADGRRELLERLDDIARRLDALERRPA